ncbi:hypothetical protein V6X69_01135 [Spiribacter sp. 370]|uniref:Uncharacterized protein n=1 Tax=Spiribacter pallidus TaxID=1987936 RepID=A0ABV3TE27_9GAMM
MLEDIHTGAGARALSDQGVIFVSALFNRCALRVPAELVDARPITCTDLQYIGLVAEATLPDEGLVILTALGDGRVMVDTGLVNGRSIRKGVTGMGDDLDGGKIPPRTQRVVEGRGGQGCRQREHRHQQDLSQAPMASPVRGG